MPTIRYSYEQPYYPVVGAGLQPALAVRLILGGATAQAVGILDTGSTVTVFNSEVAALLGIDDIFDGDAVVASTQAGSVEFYQFDLEMEILLTRSVTSKFPARVGFLAAPRARNILGRNIDSQERAWTSSRATWGGSRSSWARCFRARARN